MSPGSGAGSPGSRPPVPGGCSAPASEISTGSSSSSVAWAQPDRLTQVIGMPSVVAMPVVSATVSCAARTTSSKLDRSAGSISGSALGWPVFASAVATAVAICCAISKLTGPCDWSIRMS